LKKLKYTKKLDSKFKNENIEGIFYINFNMLSDKQKKMLHDLYLEFVRDGLKSKEAMEKALQIVNCFKI